MLISKSYWFDKPRFVNEGKLLLTTSTPSLGAQSNATITDHQGGGRSGDGGGGRGNGVRDGGNDGGNFNNFVVGGPSGTAGQQDNGGGDRDFRNGSGFGNSRFL